jgi:type I restriction enzyme M protein
MHLLTDEIRLQLPPLYSQEGNPDANTYPWSEAIAYAKFFTPDSHWTWYATEFDGKDTFFGLVQGLEEEFGYFSLTELLDCRGPLGLTIERDLWFKPTPISQLRHQRMDPSDSLLCHTFTDADRRTGIFMVDASKGFVKDGNKNRLRSQDIHKIVDVFTRQIELPRYSRMVNLEEIEKNDYNLNIPRYIDSSEPEDLHDLNAHLNGGIPIADLDALQAYWQVFPNLRKTLFAPSDRQGYSVSLVEANQVKATILNHPEFSAFADRCLSLYTQWRNDHEQRLMSITIGDKPKALIHLLSEDLLARFAKADLLDQYDIYQLLMNYWAETMQDDGYVLVQDGWAAGKVLRQLVVKKSEKLKEVPDLIIDKNKYKADLIPPKLIIDRYFATQQQQIDQLQADLDTIAQELEALIEEHSGEEGALSEAQTDAGKVTKASVTARLKELKGDASAKEEQASLKQCLKLIDREAEAKKAVKDAQVALDKLVFAQYPKLTENEIKTLVIEDKWQATLKGAIAAEIERVTQQLANRVKTLEERYAEPLPQILEEIEALSSKVDEHLKRMGLTWH